MQIKYCESHLSEKNIGYFFCTLICQDVQSANMKLSSNSYNIIEVDLEMADPS